MKSEPDTFSLDDLAARGAHGEGWDGVRNYQARNFMREMRCGDRVFFYHSAIRVPGIAGIATVCRSAYPDPTQFDPASDAYDPRATAAQPRWWQVDLRYVCHFARFVPLHLLRDTPALDGMILLRKGNRLSVMPVSEAQWTCIEALGNGCD